MACNVTKDPDNDWYVYIDWSDWFDDQVESIGGTFTLTVSDWFPDPAIVEEGTSFDDTTNKTYFSGSGGVAGEKYNILNRITYNSLTLNRTYTEDRTIQVRMKEK